FRGTVVGRILRPPPSSGDALRRPWLPRAARRPLYETPRCASRAVDAPPRRADRSSRPAPRPKTPVAAHRPATPAGTVRHALGRTAMQPNDTLIRVVETLTRVIDAADPHTRGRSLRIARCAVRIARELGTPESQLGALLHDIGRSAILNDVLQTPRPLDAGERAIVQTHPTIGWEMLREIPGLAAAAEIVYTHHERPDGKGYPRQLPADRVPLGAR